MLLLMAGKIRFEENNYFNHITITILKQHTTVGISLSGIRPLNTCKILIAFER